MIEYIYNKYHNTVNIQRKFQNSGYPTEKGTKKSYYISDKISTNTLHVHQLNTKIAELKKREKMTQTEAYNFGIKENHLKPQLHFSGKEGHLGSQCQVLLSNLK